MANKQYRCIFYHSFLQISGELNETAGYMYREKLLKISISTHTYLKIIQTGEDVT